VRGDGILIIISMKVSSITRPQVTCIENFVIHDSGF